MISKEYEVSQEEIKRDSFVFYRSYFQSVKRCKNVSQRVRIYEAIFDYALNFEKPKNLKDEDLIFWDFIEPLLNKSRKNYQNGCKPKTKTGYVNKTKTIAEQQKEMLL